MNAKPVILATDGSPSAGHAILEAVELARALQAPLLAVSVEHLPSIPGSTFYGYPELLVELRKAEHERIDEALEAACAVAEKAGVVSKRVHAEAGARVADQICHIAAELQARMIVVGAHGWNLVDERCKAASQPRSSTRLAARFWSSPLASRRLPVLSSRSRSWRRPGRERLLTELEEVQ